ncbi:hypothetical protein [Mesobacillus subterraneus]|uniref:hypothetical protein n=1 Tax=Mesobacillus subterraneus TaxID=285983 RepID=UPI001CFE7730|nr:hypothetical protein [Mesobacillus subterraneus]
MAWILFFIAAITALWAVLNVKTKPKLSLIVTALVSFIMFYFIGKTGNEEVFILASILFFISGNVLFFQNKWRQA